MGYKRLCLLFVCALASCSDDGESPPGTAKLASHPEVSLPGSNFEIDTDANLKVDDPTPPSLDWANVNEIRKADQPSGNTDDSFGGGTKEDTAVPTIVDGSIPPNKSDLKVFGVFQEGNTTSGFLNLFWTRVQDPSGTTNMDFELNQSATPSANGVTPVRTAGDLLITYDLSQGGTHPVLSLRTWDGSSWGAPVDLTTSGTATGSINSSPIPAAEADGLGALDARTFGEAQVTLSALFPNPNVCLTFGSAYLKSRSSDSFTAALKDFIAPVPINVSNCGSVKIIKTSSLGGPLAGAEFTLFKDNPPTAPTQTSHGPEDTNTGLKCTTDATGTCTILNVLQGDYWVVETVTPVGFATAADTHVTVTANAQVTVNILDVALTADIVITKKDDAGNLLDGAVFTLFNDNAPTAPGQTSHGAEDTAVTPAKSCTTGTTSPGTCTISGVTFGKYWVVETTTPTGFVTAADQAVTINSTTNVQLTFVDKRKFHTIVIVCQDQTDTSASKLVSSTVSINGQPGISTAASGQVGGLDEATLCGITAGRFNNQTAGTSTANTCSETIP